MFKSLYFLHKLFIIKFAPGNYDTEFIAEFIAHFNGTTLRNTMEAWALTSTGKRYLQGESILDDFQAYKKTDPNTLANVYVEFMEKYYFEKLSDVLDLENNVRFNERDDLGKAFGRFLIDVHDFTHVLTGYPPDPWGELLRIEYGKNWEGRGWRVLSRLSKLKFLTKGSKEWFSRRPAYIEANLMGKLAKNYIYEDWFSMLGQDINEVRKNLDTVPTTLYHWQRA